MKGFVQDIESLAVGNTKFRRVLYSARNCQLVLDGVRTKIQAGFAVLVPAGAKHDIVATGGVPLKL
jgi:hypothetical protein